MCWTKIMNDDTDWQSVAAALSTQLDAERELRREAEARYSLMQTMEADALREKLVDVLEKLKYFDGYDGCYLHKEARKILTEALAFMREDPVQLPMINEDPVITLK
jgi:hypothetical protein